MTKENKVPYRLISLLIFVISFVAVVNYLNNFTKVIGLMIIVGGTFWAGFKDAEDLEKEGDTKDE